MAAQRKKILLVDDEKAVVTVLKKSLLALGPEYQVETAFDGQAALAQLRRQRFDLVITDYNMAPVDGLALLKAIRAQNLPTKVIIITAYGSDQLEQAAQHLAVYRYITKPFNIGQFRQEVAHALLGPCRCQVPVFSPGQAAVVAGQLKHLHEEVNARCVFVTDLQGNLISQAGSTDDIAVEEISSLLGAGIATVQETGTLLSRDALDINLVYRESKHDYLYGVSIGSQFLLIIIIDRGQYSSRLGTVWYCARRVALEIFKIMRQTRYADPSRVLAADFTQSMGDELDRLLT